MAFFTFGKLGDGGEALLDPGLAQLIRVRRARLVHRGKGNLLTKAPQSYEKIGVFLRGEGGWRLAHWLGRREEHPRK